MCGAKTGGHSTEGIDAARRIRAAHPGIGVVVLSTVVYGHHMFVVGMSPLLSQGFMKHDRAATIPGSNGSGCSKLFRNFPRRGQPRTSCW